MSLWHRLLSTICKPSPNSRPPEVQKAELSPASPATQLQPTMPPVVHLSADQLSAALETWRQQHDFIQAEINAEYERTQSSLHQRRLAYLRTLHPFLRCYVPLHSFDSSVVETDELHVSGEEKKALGLDYFVVLEYFKDWINAPLTRVEVLLKKLPSESPERQALFQRYRADAALIARKANAAVEHYRHRIPRNYRWEITQKIADAFWAKYGSPRLKYQAAYDLARRGQADDFLPAPFRLLGFMGPDWDSGSILFAIDRSCFAESDPLLCYWEETIPVIDWSQAREEPYRPDDNATKYQQERFDQFVSLSSGIVPLRIQGHFFFRLDERAVKPTFLHFGEDLPTDALSPYLFPRCGSRDFHAHFGQVVDGQIVQLYQRSI